MATDKIIQDCARMTWEVMHREAKGRGMALSRTNVPGFGNIDGRVIIATVGAFIKALNSERGWNLENNDVDLVRRYLKETGNVVVLAKIEQYKFRIFIAEIWEERKVEPKTEPKKGPQLTPKDLGEDREPGEIEFKCVKCDPPTTWKNNYALYAHMAAHKEKKPKEPKVKKQSLTTRQRRALAILAEHGGTITEPKGFSSNVWAELTGEPVSYISGLQARMLERDLIVIERKSKKQRRTYKISLTKEGWSETNAYEGTRPSDTPTQEPKPEPVAQKQSGYQWGDEELLRVLAGRLGVTFVGDDQLDEIRNIIKKANDGELTPIRALVDIEGITG